MKLTNTLLTAALAAGAARALPARGYQLGECANGQTRDENQAMVTTEANEKRSHLESHRMELASTPETMDGKLTSDQRMQLQGMQNPQSDLGLESMLPHSGETPKQSTNTLGGLKALAHDQGVSLAPPADNMRLLQLGSHVNHMEEGRDDMVSPVDRAAVHSAMQQFVASLHAQQRDATQQNNLRARGDTEQAQLEQEMRSGLSQQQLMMMAKSRLVECFQDAVGGIHD